MSEITSEEFSEEEELDFSSKILYISEDVENKFMNSEVKIPVYDEYCDLLDEKIQKLKKLEKEWKRNTVIGGVVAIVSCVIVFDILGNIVKS